MTEPTIEVGDFVTIGKNKLTWRVLRIALPFADLRSGQSSRWRVEPLANLHLHTKGAVA